MNKDRGEFSRPPLLQPQRVYLIDHPLLITQRPFTLYGIIAVCSITPRILTREGGDGLLNSYLLHMVKILLIATILALTSNRMRDKYLQASPADHITPSFWGFMTFGNMGISFNLISTTLSLKILRPLFSIA